MRVWKEVDARSGAAVLTAFLWLFPSWVLACPACKDALSGSSVGAALSWTTLLLIAVPLLLVGSIGGWVAYAYWRAAHASAAETVPPVPTWPVWAEKESET